MLYKVIVIIGAFLICVKPCKASSQGEKWYEEINGTGKCDGSIDYSDTINISCKHGMFRARNFARNFDTLPRMAEVTNQALSGIIKIASWNLSARGFDDEAAELEREWLLHDGEISRIIARRDYGIGDFAPLSNFLRDTYERLEKLLSYDVCYALRLTDIKTINYAIPICFNPCPTGLGEFTAHFCGDAHVLPSKPHPFRGLGPITAYYSVSISCGIALFGAGWAPICSPLAMVVERMVDWKLVEPLANRIYERVCL